jgi:uncharacterized protein YpbB
VRFERSSSTIKTVGSAGSEMASTLSEWHGWTFCQQGCQFWHSS